MKVFSLLAFSLVSSALIVAPQMIFLPAAGAQASTTSPAANANTPLTSDLAAVKAAERKKRFDEAKKKLENSDPRPQEQPKDAASNSSHVTSPSNSSYVSPNDLSLSPILVNMLVGNTQNFSLFDVAGHKLTSQADWTVSDSSIAELSVIDGIPSLVSKQTGTVHIRARIDARSAEATVNVVTPDQMKPGTILWQAPAVPGFKPVQIVPAVPSSGTHTTSPSDSGRAL